jgi:hypothetical protein
MGVEIDVSISLCEVLARTSWKLSKASPVAAFDIVVVTARAYTVNNVCSDGLDGGETASI